ncbi:DUF7660 family protein [Nonomuraea sediminis]|uniref:DUF7660 family protein n=1 Tax=Nonomuraea sediminis TaxID=2835864 RepID=UPI001BDCDAE5|nr:hypothetical protein [Nonomuraea sediminis]
MSIDDGSFDAASAVASREDLARFVEALHGELVNGADWENDRLDLFLEALAAWIRDSPGLHAGNPAPETARWFLLRPGVGGGDGL